MLDLPRLRTWLDCQPGADRLTPELRDLYGGPLAFPPAPAARPHCFGNFVATLDGVVSFAVPGQSGGGTISGGDDGDQFVMGLLRASADAIIVGAGTLAQVPPAAAWTAAALFPPAAALYREMQARDPLFVVVSGSGNINLDRKVFRSPAVILTSPEGRTRLAHSGLDIRVLPLTGAAIAAVLHREYGVRCLLHEGGPTLLGEFLRAGVLDEIFLTLAPRIAGRAPEAPRPGMVEGVAFSPGEAPRGALISGKERNGFLYLRYRTLRAGRKGRGAGQGDGSRGGRSRRRARG